MRSRSVEELLTWVATHPHQDVIIGGDFNTVPLSKSIRAMGKVFKNTLGASSDYFTGTYMKSSLPIEPRIDYIFHSQDINCGDSSVIRDSAGDHYPVRAVFYSNNSA